MPKAIQLHQWEHLNNVKACQVHKTSAEVIKERGRQQLTNYTDLLQEQISTRKKILDGKLVAMIAKDLQPLPVMEDEGFLEFSKALDRKYR